MIIIIGKLARALCDLSFREKITSRESHLSLQFLGGALSFIECMLHCRTLQLQAAAA